MNDHRPAIPHWRSDGPPVEPATSVDSDGPVAVDVQATFWVRTDHNDAVVCPNGDIDLANLDLFAEVLEHARRLQPRRVIIDFTDTQFLACCTMQLLDAERHHPDTELVLRNAHGIVGRVLDIAGLDTEPPARKTNLSVVRSA